MFHYATRSAAENTLILPLNAASLLPYGQIMSGNWGMQPEITYV